MAGEPMWKPSRTKRRKETIKARLDLATMERKNKAAVRKRDGGRCRFPLCGCKPLRLRLEVSHDEHKGMGGDPTGERSATDGMIYLCVHRHQDGAVSRHKGTLRTAYLTPARNAGPVAWEIRTEMLARIFGPGWERYAGPDLLKATDCVTWVEVARETWVQKLEPLKPWQRALLETLAEMEL